jgi:addiction module RelB/DinJ family antitoxin
MITVAQDRISFRINSDIKKQAEIIASELGTNTSAVLTMTLHAFVRKRGIPFDVSLTETYEDRQMLNNTLDQRQAVIDEGDEANFVAHEDVKKMIGL